MEQKATLQTESLVQGSLIKVAKRSKAWLAAMNEQATIEPNLRQVESAA